MLASPLHRRYLEYLLFPSKSELEDVDIFKFITKVIPLMSPVSIAEETRQLGAFVQSIPETPNSEGILCRLLRIRGQKSGVISRVRYEKWEN